MVDKSLQCKADPDGGARPVTDSLERIYGIEGVVSAHEVFVTVAQDLLIHWITQDPLVGGNGCVHEAVGYWLGASGELHFGFIHGGNLFR